MNLKMIVVGACVCGIFGMKMLYAAIGDELLINGDFEAGTRAPWIGGSIGDSSSPYQPDLHTTFISGTYCGIIQRPFDASLVYASQSQIFTNTAPCYAKLSWKCKRRTNNSNAVYYRVTVDGNVIWGEEKFTGNEIWYRKVDNVKLTAGEHTLAFQVRTDNNIDSTLFIDNVSLQDKGTTITELLLNGDFETGSRSPGWTGSGTIDNSSSAYGPEHTTPFIAGNYCSTIQMSRYMQQVFTNDATYVATLSWRCKHRTNFFAENPMYYTVTIDGNAVYGEEKLTGSVVYSRSVEGIKLEPGEHTLVFQGRTDNNQDSSFFLDDVSLWVTEKKSNGLTVFVR